jgi:hypothetical protein
MLLGRTTPENIVKDGTRIARRRPGARRQRLGGTFKGNRCKLVPRRSLARKGWSSAGPVSCARHSLCQQWHGNPTARPELPPRVMSPVAGSARKSPGVWSPLSTPW